MLRSTSRMHFDAVPELSNLRRSAGIPGRLLHDNLQLLKVRHFISCCFGWGILTIYNAQTVSSRLDFPLVQVYAAITSTQRTAKCMRFYKQPSDLTCFAISESDAKAVEQPGHLRTFLHNDSCLWELALSAYIAPQSRATHVRAEQTAGGLRAWANIKFQLGNSEAQPGQTKRHLSPAEAESGKRRPNRVRNSCTSSLGPLMIHGLQRVSSLVWRPSLRALILAPPLPMISPAVWESTGTVTTSYPQGLRGQSLKVCDMEVVVWSLFKLFKSGR